MKSAVIGAIMAGVGGLALGFLAGWEMRKRQEVQWEVVSEEEQQAYAAQFGDAEVNSEPEVTEQKDIHEEGTNINPAMDTRKQDYANAWKEQQNEIVRRESYGSPTPGDEEDLSVSEDDIDQDFMEEIPGPRIETISDQEFYNDKGDLHREIIFWYDRDDVLTRLNDDETEEVISDENDFFRGVIDVRKEFMEAKDLVEERAGTGLYLFRKDNHSGTLYQLVRYPMSYGKRAGQEEYGGTGDSLEWIHSRNKF